MPKADASVLKRRSRVSRCSVARGLPSMAAGTSEASPIDRDGGDYGAGLIRGAAVISRGEALGHDFWVDSSMLDQVVAAINGFSRGSKSRFAHPSLSGDGMGTFLGRFKNAYRDGDTVRADQHLAKSAHNTPNGDLASYVMDLAEEDPKAFGSSIAFKHDEDAEEEFANTHNQGGIHDHPMAFRSPDALNTSNIPHARLKKLVAVDVVDSPAASPNGFLAEQELAEDATQLARYALGLQAEQPALSALGSQFGTHPDRLREFVGRFLDSNGLSIIRKESVMTIPAPKPAETPAKPAETQPTKPAEATPPATPPAKPEEKPAEKPAEKPVEPTPEKPAEVPAPTPAATPAPTPAATPAPTSTLSIAAEVKRYVDAFGAQGATWLAEGKPFDECQRLYVDALKARNAELGERLKQAGGGQATPLSFSPKEGVAKPAPGKESRLEQALGKNLASFAASIKLPGKN